jgi:multiple sugar transport system substrate-binding protein
MRKSLWAVAAIAALSAALSASATAGHGGAKVTTVTLSGWSSSPAETASLNETIAAFEKSHPTIKVNYSPINGDYPSAMIAKFAARTPPDVFYVDSNVFPDWAKQGTLLPLDSYIKKTKFKTSAFYPRLLDAFRYKGHIYGFPKDWSSLGIEINSSMMTKAGVTSAPKTWAQLSAAATKLNTSGAVPGGKPMCLAADWARLGAFVFQNGGSFLNAKGTAATFNTPRVAGAVQYYLSYIQRGLAATPAQLGVGWCGEALGKGKAAIAMEGPWITPYMSDTFPSLSYKAYPMVSKGPNKGRGNLAFTVSYSIGRDSPNKNEAWTLLSYLTGKQGMKVWTSKGVAMSSRSDVKPLASQVPFAAAAPYSHAWQFAPGFHSVMDQAGNELQAVFDGKESVATMLQNVQSQATAALNGG